ncbi:MAG: alpha-glucuronidase family glycosyl hydrolase, partial [Mucilaginibacter sp.]
MKNCLKLYAMLVLGFSILLSQSIAADVPVTLIKANKSRWQITTASTTKEAKFAAGELQKYLAKIGGATIPVALKAKTGYNIILGLRSDIPAVYKKLLPAAAKGYNAYAVSISAKPATIVIAGEDGQGLIYGAYDLLEKLGCRWFYPRQDANDPEVVPQLSTVTTNTSAWTVASPTKYRIYNGDGWFFKMDYDLAKEQLDWAMKNRYNAVGWQALASNAKISLLDQYNNFKKYGVESELDKRGMFI